MERNETKHVRLNEKTLAEKSRRTGRGSVLRSTRSHIRLQLTRERNYENITQERRKVESLTRATLRVAGEKMNVWKTGGAFHGGKTIRGERGRETRSRDSRCKAQLTATEALDRPRGRNRL